MGLIQRKSGRPAVGKRLDWIKSNLWEKYTKNQNLTKNVRWRQFLRAAHVLLTGEAIPDSMVVSMRRMEIQLRAMPHSRLDRYLPWIWRALNEFWDAPAWANANLQRSLVRTAKLQQMHRWLQTSPHWHGQLSWVKAAGLAADLAQKTPGEKPVEVEDDAALYRWPDGWTLLRLETEGALLTEGKVMRHSVGEIQHWEGIEAGVEQILSLRDPNNKPHVTIELARRVGAKLWQIIQIQGKGNSRPKRKYLSRLVESLPPEVDRRSDYFTEAGLAAHIAIQGLIATLQTKGKAEYKGRNFELLPGQKLQVTEKFAHQIMGRSAEFKGMTPTVRLARNFLALDERVIPQWGWPGVRDVFRFNDYLDYTTLSLVRRKALAGQIAIREYLLKDYGTLTCTRVPGFVQFTQVVDVRKVRTELQWLDVYDRTDIANFSFEVKIQELGQSSPISLKLFNRAKEILKESFG